MAISYISKKLPVQFYTVQVLQACSYLYIYTQLSIYMYTHTLTQLYRHIYTQSCIKTYIYTCTIKTHACNYINQTYKNQETLTIKSRTQN